MRLVFEIAETANIYLLCTYLLDVSKNRSYLNVNCLYTGSFFVIKMFKPLINHFFIIWKIKKFAPPQETSGGAESSTGLRLILKKTNFSTYYNFYVFFCDMILAFA